MKKQVVMIEVQPTATGARLLETVIARGFELLLLTNDEPWFRAHLPRETQAATTVIPVEWHADKRGQILALLARADRASLAGIMTVRDRFVEAVSEVAAELGLPFTDGRAVATCRNKDRTRAVMSDLGLLNARHRVAKTFEDARDFCRSAGFPVVLKPSKGSGSAGVRLCADEAELARAFPELLRDCAVMGESVLVEEFVPGPVVGVESVTFQGRTKVLGILDRGVAGPHPNFSATSWTFPAPLAPEIDKQLRETATRILDHIGYRLGFSHMEFVLGAHGPVPGEVNARMIGVNVARLMTTTLGVDVLGIMVDLFTGGDLQWLFDRELAPRQAMTELAVKPDRNGKVTRVAGVELARRYPGVVSVLDGLQAGDEVVDRHNLLTFGARIFTCGDTAYESLMHARAAAVAIQMDVEGL
jgi:biotin carboxylase